ncbi:MAG: ABC transporter ATP-binding protein [Sporolactobacillus sp.]
MENSTSIALEKINKYYGKNQVIDDLSLSIKKGEFLILLGASGCGKSTTLRMIAGLETISSGNLLINGIRQNDRPAGQRNIAMVFQDYALYPHMTVEDNITYGLRVNKLKKEEIANRLEKVLTVLNLNGLEKRYPRNLSGGQRQRVALARAIAKQSPIFLLDEPLSNLDAQMRLSARKELLKIHEIYQQTIIYVTHDQIEALTLGDRIALLDQGKLQMLDTPFHVYHHPVNVFVAKFIGTPSTNIIEANYRDRKFFFESAILPAESAWIMLIEKAGLDHIYLGIRPEYIQLTRKSTADAVSAIVRRVEIYGSRYGVILQFNEQEITAISETSDWVRDERVFFTFSQRKMYVFDGDTKNSIGFVDQQTSVGKGEGRIEAID